jgi:hypothetical protein
MARSMAVELVWDDDGTLLSVEPYWGGKCHGTAKQYGRDGRVIGTYRWFMAPAMIFGAIRVSTGLTTCVKYILFEMDVALDLLGLNDDEKSVLG